MAQVPRRGNQHLKNKGNVGWRKPRVAGSPTTGYSESPRREGSETTLLPAENVEWGLQDELREGSGHVDWVF